jgi:hypothetical protein
LCAAKCFPMSHWLLGKSAPGSPNLAVSRSFAPLLTAAGTALSPRDQNQTRISDGVRSSTYQPPPALLNAGPYESGERSPTPHPAFPFTAVLQSACLAVLRARQRDSGDAESRPAHPCIARLPGMLQPGLVCSVTEFGPASLTPSTMSTSPLTGQLFSATSHAACAVRQQSASAHAETIAHRPGAAALRHVPDVEHCAQSALRPYRNGRRAGGRTGDVVRVRLVRLDAHAHPARAGRAQLGGVIRAHDERVAVRVREVVLERRRLVNVRPASPASATGGVHGDAKETYTRPCVGSGIAWCENPLRKPWPT